MVGSKLIQVELVWEDFLKDTRLAQLAWLGG